jgi:DNA-binding response OmpR family regulator
MRIALADDQPGELAWIEAILRESGHECQTYRNGDEVVAALRRESFDLLLLDWNMPQLDGIATLAWIQQNVENPPPVIMLTSRAGKDDIVKALDLGACDFITKPEDANVVRARVAAALRRHSSKGGETAVFGDFRFIRSTQTVEFGGEAIALRAKEFDLARLLFDNLDRPLSRGYLLQRIWNSSPDIETRTLDMHISRIRAKLQLGPERGFALRTVFGFGYRLDSSGNDIG